MHPEIIQYDKTYKLIEFGKGSEKLSLDFRYIFSGMLKLGETIRLGDTDCDLKDMPGPYVCCAYDRSAAKKEMTGAGLSCGKDYLFAEDLFYLLDDLKGSKIAYATCSKKISDRLKAVSFGYAAKHGKILPEDPYAEILSGGHRRSSRSPVMQRLYHAIYLIPGLIEAIPQLFASGKEYEGYDLICFADAANAIGYKKDHPDAGDRVITTEMLKARTMASLYMRAVYFDKDQYTCECDMPFKTLWIGKGGTARLCDCPDYLDVSCGNIGVLSASDVWDSPMARIIRLSVINNTYTFCSKNLCGKFAGGCRSAEVLKRTDITAADHPLTMPLMMSAHSVKRMHAWMN